MKKKISLIFGVISLGVFALFSSCKSTQTEDLPLPNVLVILVDDAGYIDFGFMGSEDLETPQIDRLAEMGTVFTDAHVSASVCAPSRAGLLTGQYQQRFGFEANGTGGIGLSDEVMTMGDVFQEAGYETYALGKWHLGEEESDHPNERGFEEFYGFIGGSRSYFPLDSPNANHAMQLNGVQTTFEGYLTDALGDAAVTYIENAEDPFFMYLAFNAVHTPMEAKKVDLERFENHPRQVLAAMTWSLDENVGKVLDALEKQGELDNTLIIFLSDNGGAHSNDSKVGLFKAWKGYKFEGGHRVPMVVSWPRKLPKGETHPGLTSALDIFATGIDAAGISVPSSHRLDGVSLIPYLQKKKTGSPHDTLYWRKLDVSAARIGDYKLVTLDGYASVMYDLSTDIGEENDLSDNQPDKKKEIQAGYSSWSAGLMNPLWVEGKNWMDVNRHVHQSLMENKEPLYKDPWQHRRYLESQKDK